MKPKFVLSKSKSIEQYNKVKQYADIVSYSSKTNQDVTKILEQNTDSMFSVHFENELKHINDFSRVIFLAQAWNKTQIQELINKGIKWFIVDNESDLDILINFLNNNQTKINLLLRTKLRENTIKTEKYFVFGMDSETINKRLKQLRENNSINKLGIHFHRKTQNVAEWNLTYEISNIIEDFSLLDIVNIGGGIPSEYANTNVEVINSIFKRIDEFKDFLEQKQIQMIIEPGRFIAAPAVKLVTYIVSIDQNNITVNCSVYNTDMDAIVVPVKLKVENEGKGTPYIIKGITPCSLDLFRYRVYLENPKVGDVLTFLNAGAYNFSSDFCDLEKLETEVVE